MLQITVPAQDDAIDSALSELDTRLSAWLEAMEEAQIALAVAWDTPASTVDPGAGEAGAVQEPVVAAVETPVEEVIDPAADSEAGGVEDVSVSPAEALESLVEPESPPAIVEAEAGADTELEAEPESELEVRTVIEAPPEVPEASAASKPSAAEEDEALLATLDEKTVKALRVMRRLSPVRRSMRELLEEYRAEEAGKSDAPAPSRKSWWKRK